MGYLSPTSESRSEQEVKRSRFIGIARAVRSAEEVKTALDAARAEFPDATHHCWAYVLGDPASSPQMRTEDDGEPGGTAGRPILNVLTQRRLGDTLVIVVRYFGGVKLGAGGLVRAYGSAASAALDRAPLSEATTFLPVTLRYSYGDERGVRHVLEKGGLTELTVDYGEDVVMTAKVPAEAWDALREALSDVTRGRIKIDAPLI